MHHRTFANEIRRYNVKTWCICNIGTLIRPIWFCSKICHVGGRIVSAPTQMVPPNDRAEISVGVGAVLRAANQNPMIAGGDHTIIQRIVSARLFPLWGNNVGAKRRQCNIKHYTVKFGGTMSKYGIFATLLHHPTNMVLLKNLQRWRADNIRPYTVCATELLSGDFGGHRVGANAPTMQYQTFANEIRRYNVETLYILQHCYITRPIQHCLKNDKNYSSPVTKGRIREVRRPATTRDRLLTAPVRGLSSLALAVPMTWAAVP